MKNSHWKESVKISQSKGAVSNQRGLSATGIKGTPPEKQQLLLKVKNWSRSLEVRTPAEHFHEKGTEQAGGCVTVRSQATVTRPLPGSCALFPGTVTGDIFLQQGNIFKSISLFDRPNKIATTVEFYCS